MSGISNLILNINNRQGLKPYCQRNSWAYGVIIDETQANPDLVRIGNSDMAKAAICNELAIQGTLLNGDLKPFSKASARTYKDGTPAILDGSAGNVVTYHPGFYYAVEDVSATVHKLWVSPYPIIGFKFMSFTTGCYKASVNNTAVYGKPVNSLWSVVNDSPVFRGGNNSAVNDALQKGFLGKPRTVLSRTQFRGYAQSYGLDYGLIDYNTHVGLFLLFVSKYATLNAQKPFSAVKDANGYFTGGLGDGLTTVASADWNTYNGYYPLVKCGQNLDLGINDGEVSYTLLAFNAGGNLVVKVPSFMGIESSFGDIWEWAQGINFWKQTVPEGDKFMAYIYDNGVYEDAVTNKYSRSFEFIKAEGWVKSMKLGPFADLIASVVNNGASSSTFYSDYFYNSTSPGYRGLFRSGDADLGSSAGLSFAYSISGFSDAYASVGSRIGFYGRVRPVG